MTEPVWYHVDVNSAFLSWTAAFNTNIKGHALDLRSIPSVIGGDEENRHGIVLAKSVPAKKYRITAGEPLITARQKCPGLLVVPPDYELYVRCSEALIGLLGKYSGDIHQYSIDEAFVNMSGASRLYGGPVAFAEQLKHEIKTALGFTVNIGVSYNKIMAKMASEFRKPDMVHTLFRNEIADKLWPLPVSDLFYVGRATAKKLRGLGIKTIGELAEMDKGLIKQHLKKHGGTIWDYANGIDVSPYLMPMPENKGYGNSMTVPCDIDDGERARQVLLALTETVCARMRADGMKATCLSVSVTDWDFIYGSKQMQLMSETDITSVIYEAACHIFDGFWNKTPIRQLGVCATRLTRTEICQYDLFGDSDKLLRLDRAIDRIRSRYGEDSIMRASFLEGNIPHMAGGIDRAKRTGITK